MDEPARQPPMRHSYRIIRCTAQMLFVALFRGRVFGMRNVPRQGGVLLVSNHQSFFDPILVSLAIPRECSYMARHTLFHHTLLRRVIEFLNAFPVKRNSADVGAIKETMRRLKAGKVVLTFPEGTRTPDGSIGPMRAGVVLLARKTGVPIVPTLVLGAFESWPRTAGLPTPRPILVAYGEPIYPHEYAEWTDDQCVDLVRTRIVRMKERYESLPTLGA